MIRFGIVVLLAAALFNPSCGDFASSYALDCTRSCEVLGHECGTWLNECQEPVNCGDCAEGLTCNADGFCVEECVAKTCQELDKQCGHWNDGCNHDLDCGDCPADRVCNAAGMCVDGSYPQEDKVSDCGGFEAAGESLFDDSKDKRSDYCDAEVLHWLYDEATQRLKLADARVLLNCCGDHSMTVEEVDGVYVFTETDAPEGGWGRCLCMCVYDFVIKVDNIPPGTISIRIDRVVTDRPEGSGLVYEGELDLTLGSGSEVIDDTDVADWCY
jgi:hypothetical protein